MYEIFKRSIDAIKQLWKIFLYYNLLFLRFLIDNVSDIIFGVLHRNKKNQTLPPITNHILLQSAQSLAEKIRSKKAKSVDVVEAFIARIRQVNPTLNAVVNENFIEALREARKVDDLIASGVKDEAELKKKMPFLGVPITIKESIATKGLHHTVGLRSRKEVISDEDAHVVTLMRKAGAIIIGNTNVPELTMWWDASNNVYGTTCNPYDFSRIPGGSSGGEGSIIAAGGSIIGIGTDVGGSIRLPAFFCGIFGHKPSPNIVSNEGQIPKSEGLVKTYNTTGPLCRYAADLVPMLKVLAGENAKKLKLDEKVDLTSVRFFYQDNDGGNPFASKVVPEIHNALERIVKYFDTTHGIKFRKTSINKIKHAFTIWRVSMATSGGTSLCEEMAERKGKVNAPMEFLKWLVWCSNHTLAAIAMGVLENLAPSPNSETYQKIINIRTQLEKELQDLLGSDGVFLIPTQPRPAPYLNQSLLMPYNIGYTGIFNILGLPSTNCPMGLNDDGLPIGIQVVANRNNDHLCLAVAKELEQAFGGWVSPSTIM